MSPTDKRHSRHISKAWVSQEISWGGWHFILDEIILACRHQQSRASKRWPGSSLTEADISRLGQRPSGQGVSRADTENAEVFISTPLPKKLYIVCTVCGESIPGRSFGIVLRPKNIVHRLSLNYRECDMATKGTSRFGGFSNNIIFIRY